MTSPMSVAWNLVARQYAEHFVPDFIPAAEALCDFAAVAPGERVLDVACGPGTASLVARGRGAARVTGVDFAPEMVAIARARAAGQDGFDFVAGSAEALPVPGGAFDVVLSSFGVIFAPDPGRAVAEMARALHPNGRVALLAWLQRGSAQEYYDTVSRYVARTPSRHDPYEWGAPERAAAWLGESFTSIESRPLTVTFNAESPEAAWRVHSTSSGRVALEYRALEPSARAELDRTMHRFFSRFQETDGRVRWPREALMVRGRKPVPRAGAPGEVFI